MIPPLVEFQIQEFEITPQRLAQHLTVHYVQHNSSGRAAFWLNICSNWSGSTKLASAFNEKSKTPLEGTISPTLAAGLRAAPLIRLALIDSSGSAIQSNNSRPFEHIIRRRSVLPSNPDCQTLIHPGAVKMNLQRRRHDTKWKGLIGKRHSLVHRLADKLQYGLKVA